MTDDTPLGKTLNTLYATTGEEPKRSGLGWSARCPSHDDRHESLSVGQGDDGRVLVHCHAGCSAAAVVAAMGLRLTDVMPSDNGRPTRPKPQPARKRQTWPTAAEAVAALEQRHGRRSATWAYHNAGGELVSLAVRWDTLTGKDIRPVSRGADGRWFIGAMPEPRPLYGVESLGTANRVYVCEGEKCADAARGIGLVAVTSAGGSGAAAKSDWSPLAGHDVVLLPDNDDAGRKYADDVTSILRGLSPPATVRVVALPGLPPGGDVADYADTQRSAGVSDDDIRATVERLADAAPRVAAPGPHDDDSPEWPAPMGDDAYHGLAGDIVRAIEPHSEADPVALLVQTLAAFGSVIGRTGHFRAEADTHFCNLFAVLVGETSKGRKGTSWGHVANLFRTVDPDWFESRVMTGLSSGEGLIWAVRDPITKHEAIRERGHVTGYADVVTDPGIEDKRLLIIEPEYASVLQVCAREKNTLSAILRQSWDGGNLRTLTKNSPARATGAHVSIVAHATAADLQLYMAQTDLCNGYANRFLYLAVRRSKCLPEGGRLHQVDMGPLVRRLADAVDFSRGCAELRRDDAARALWCRVYPSLSEGKPGLYGAVIARAEAQVMRLATTYALLDQSPVIKVQHLRAGLALWRYAEDSVRWAFGRRLGESPEDRARRDLVAWIERRGGTVTARDLQRNLARFKTAEVAEGALNDLARAGLGQWQHDDHDGDRGRPVRYFRLRTPTDTDTNGTNTEENSKCVGVGGVGDENCTRTDGRERWVF